MEAPDQPPSSLLLELWDRKRFDLVQGADRRTCVPGSDGLRNKPGELLAVELGLLDWATPAWSPRIRQYLQGGDVRRMGTRNCFTMPAEASTTRLL